MAESIFGRARKAWNAFFSRDPTPGDNVSGGYYYRPDRPRLSRGNERSLVTAIYTRIALDVANIQIKHVRLDERDRYMETIDSGLNDCFNIEANLDQTGRAFVQDAVMSMLDEGAVALTPIITDRDPNDANGSFDIYNIRTGKIVEWYPSKVKVNIYNEWQGKRQDKIFDKRAVAIIENPMYAIMNEPNSLSKRLARKLAILDAVDEQAGAGKLDLIIQLPYVIKSEARKKQAEDRRKDIEQQLAGSKYGIAYTDGTEHITQLNRSLENNLLKQIEYFTNMLFSQLGITQSILDGTADEQTMLNYYNRTVEPIISAITDEMNRKFLTKTARTQKQAIKFYRDPFKLVPVAQLAELADKMTRNEIMTSNEFRQIIGYKPAEDPRADELRNKNLSQSNEEVEQGPQSAFNESEEE